MPLSDTKIRSAKPLDKPYKLSYGEGLYLQVTPNGSRLWRLKYRFEGKEKLLALGRYAAVGLAEARKGPTRRQIEATISPYINA